MMPRHRDVLPTWDTYYCASCGGWYPIGHFHP